MKSYITDSKMRARIRSAAQTVDAVLSLGKNVLTPEFTKSVEEYMEKHEIIKINVLKNNHGNKNLKRNAKILKGKNYYD